MHNSCVSVGKWSGYVLLQERKKQGVDNEQVYLADVMAYQVCCLLYAQHMHMSHLHYTV